MLRIRSLFILAACLSTFVLASTPPLLAAGAVVTPSNRIAADPASDVTLTGYVETPAQIVTIEAFNQNTGARVTLGTAKAATTGKSYTPPSGTPYTAYAWSYDAGVLPFNLWAPQTVVPDVATNQGHAELIATAGGQVLATFSPEAAVAALASQEDPQTAASNFSDGKSTVLFDRNGVGSGQEGPWVTVAGMVSDSHVTGYSPVAWSVGSYTVEGGMKIYALVCAPLTGGPYPVVIYNHGGTGSTDGGNISGFITPSGWTDQPFLPGVDAQLFINPVTSLPVIMPDGLGQCLDWAKRGWVFATSAYRGESVNIVSTSPDFKTPAKPWASAGGVEFCMGEVTDVLALTDLVVNHPSSIALGNTSQRIPIRVNGQVFMYGYSHGGCITYRAVQQGAPVTAFSVIEGFTDVNLNYLNALAATPPLTPPVAAVGAGAYQPYGAWFYLPDAVGVMGYNWRSAHYFASAAHGDLAIDRFKTMPILILQGDIDTGNPVPLSQPAEIAADIGTTNIFVGPTGFPMPTSEPCMGSQTGLPIPSSMTAPPANCAITFTPKDTGASCVSTFMVELPPCPVVAEPFAPPRPPQLLHYFIVYHNMNHTNGGLAIKATFDSFVEQNFGRKPGCDGLEADCKSD